MDPHQQRVITEKTELDDKLKKLGLFLGTEIFHSLDEDEMSDLNQQWKAMAMYSDILGRRIARFDSSKKEAK